MFPLFRVGTIVTTMRMSDAEAVDKALDRFTRGSVPIRRLTKRILRAQRRLQKQVNERAWLVFLEIEETTGERVLRTLDASIRIALRRGPSRRSV